MNKQNQPDQANPEDYEIVLFQRGNTALQPGEVKLHGLREFTSRLFGRKIEDVKSEWEKVSRQVAEILSTTLAEAPKGFVVDEIALSLGFSAQGKIVFIAEAGVETSIELKFKRVAGV